MSRSEEGFPGDLHNGLGGEAERNRTVALLWRSSQARRKNTKTDKSKVMIAILMR